MNLKLCLVTQFENTSLDDYKSFLLKVISGGVTHVQLRAKHQSKNELLEIARELKSILPIPLMINDNVEIAREVNAAGVHLGQSDMSPIEARKRLGPDKIIGVSIESMADLEKANQTPDLNYVAASAVFPSQTKLDCKTIWGLEGLKQIVSYSKYPVLAIGGIDLTNVASVMSQGASGVAIVKALHESHTPKQTAEKFKRIIEGEKHE